MFALHRNLKLLTNKMILVQSYTIAVLKLTLLRNEFNKFWLEITEVDVIFHKIAAQNSNKKKTFGNKSPENGFKLWLNFFFDSGLFTGDSSIDNVYICIIGRRLYIQFEILQQCGNGERMLFAKQIKDLCTWEPIKVWIEYTYTHSIKGKGKKKEERKSNKFLIFWFIKKKCVSS